MAPLLTTSRKARFALALVAAAAALLPASRAAAETVLYDPHYDFMLNPEAGFMTLMTLDHTTSSKTAVLAGIDNLRATDHSIAWVVIDLNKYRNTNTLGGDIKNNITAMLTRVKDRGVKAIVRLRYHTTASFTPPEATLARQLTHLDQLGPIFTNYNNVIICYQAGGFGAYGEWYYTANTSASARRQLLDKMFSVLPADALIQVRTPWYKREYAASGALADRVARVGHYNDCFLTGPTDYGTYSCYPSSGTCPTVNDLRDDVRLDSMISPVGGETCPLEGGQPETYNDCTSPHDQMAYLGWSFINTAYYQPYITEWQTQGCWPDIRRRMGYRYEVVTSTVPDQIQAGQPFTVSFTVRNQGFAPIYDSRPVYIKLLSSTDQELVYYWVANCDPRNWQPLGGDETYTQTQNAPTSLPAGTIKVALWIPDKDPALYYRPEYSVRLASKKAGVDIWDGAASRGYNVLKAGIPVVP